MHLPAILSAMAPEAPRVSPSDEHAQADGFLAVVQLDAEGMMPEMQTILASTAERSMARPVRPERSRQNLSQKLNRGIRKLGEGRYEIKRSMLELALGNLVLLSSLVRVEPEIRDGKPFGYRLFAISVDGPMAKLGLRNDDVLVSVNGLDIATPERVLQAYSELRTASQFALGLVRDGRQISQAYTIR